MSNCRHWNIAVKGMAFDPQTGDTFQLNETAKVILNSIREGLSPEQISTEISRRFGVPYEKALTDVFEFMVQLDSMSEAA